MGIRQVGTRKVVAAFLMALAAAALAGMATPAADAEGGDYWVKNNQGHKVGWVRETGPTIDDWSYVFTASGKEVGSSPGHWAKLIDDVQFFGEKGGIWIAIGTNLYTAGGRKIGYATKRGARWLVFKRTSSGARHRGTVQGSLPAPHALMGLRLLLW